MMMRHQENEDPEGMAVSSFKQRFGFSNAMDDIAALCGRETELDALILHFLHGLVTAFKSDDAAIYLCRKDGSLDCHVLSTDTEGMVARLRFGQGEGTAGWVVRERRSVLLSTAESDLSFFSGSDSKLGRKSGNLAAVPLICRSEPVGVLEVIRQTDTKSSFGGADLELMETVAVPMAAALNNARITSELRERMRRLELELEDRVGQVVLAKNEWEATVDAFIDPVLLVDANYRVRRANRSLSLMSSVPLREVTGRVCYELAFGRSTPCDGCPLPRALIGQTSYAELENAGSTYQASHFPVRQGDGRVYAVACSYRDVTKSREMERRLYESEVMASIGRLAAGVSHEINNPLAFMASNLGVLAEYFQELALASGRSSAVVGTHSSTTGKSAAEGGSSQDLATIVDDGLAILEDVKSGVLRISHIVRQLGLFSRQKRPRETVFDVKHSVDRVVRQFWVDFPKATIEVVSNSETPVRGCQVSLESAVAAVVRNALQASPALVSIRVERDGGNARVIVDDAGSGIDEVMRTKVFEPFFTTREVGAGMGLGLSTAYSTMMQHHGGIEVMDSPLGGARVVMRLPLASATCG